MKPPQGENSISQKTYSMANFIVQGEFLNTLLAYWLNFSEFFKSLSKPMWKWQCTVKKIHVFSTIQKKKKKHKQLKYSEGRKKSWKRNSKMSLLQLNRPLALTYFHCSTTGATAVKTLLGVNSWGIKSTSNVCLTLAIRIGNVFVPTLHLL